MNLLKYMLTVDVKETCNTNLQSSPSYSSSSDSTQSLSSSSSSKMPDFSVKRRSTPLSSVVKPVEPSTLPVSRAHLPAIVPIVDLHPSRGQRYTIKAKVCAKGDMHPWSNGNGKGELFSFDIIDNSNSAIRVTAFHGAAKKWFPILQEDKVYIFSTPMKLGKCNPKYNTLPHPFEITINEKTIIELLPEDPQQSFSVGDLVLENLRTISDTRFMNDDDSFDLIGIY